MKKLHTNKGLLLAICLGIFLTVPLVSYGQDFSLSGLLISIVGYLLYIAAMIFDASIQYFVLQMGVLVSGEIGISINLVWGIVRDLINLTFIFGLVYIGIKTILNASTDTKKLLAKLVVFALLVNFSLFISKVVIDVSNVTAIEIYEAMQIRELDQRSNLADISIATAFLAQMGISQLVTVPNAQGEVIEQFAGSQQKMADGAYLPFVIGSTIFILVAAFVFAAGAILIAIRFAVLIIVMMLSPVAFAAEVFPVFAGWSKLWWKTLLSQSFFAPAYLFMLYLTLKISEGYQSHTSAFDKIYINGAARGGDFTAAAFFCITIIMMVASLVVAKKMGAYGANTAVAIGNKGRYMGQRFLGASTAGLAARAGRGTLGVGASRLKETKWMQNWAASKGLTGYLGRNAINVADRTSKASFDARRVAGVGKKLGVGEGKKGGYEQTLKDIQNKEKATAKLLDNTTTIDESAFDKADPAVKMMRQQVKTYENERTRLRTELATEQDPTKRAALENSIRVQTNGINAIEKDDEYAKVKKAAEVSIRKRFATNLEQRGDNLPGFARYPYRIAIRSKRENKKAADAVRKDMNKTDTDKLIDALEKGNKKEAESKDK